MKNNASVAAANIYEDNSISRFLISICYLISEADRINNQKLVEIFSETMRHFEYAELNPPSSSLGMHDFDQKDALLAIEFIQQCKNIEISQAEKLLGYIRAAFDIRPN